MGKQGEADPSREQDVRDIASQVMVSAGHRAAPEPQGTPCWRSEVCALKGPLPLASDWVTEMVWAGWHELQSNPCLTELSAWRDYCVSCSETSLAEVAASWAALRCLESQRMLDVGQGLMHEEEGSVGRLVRKEQGLSVLLITFSQRT